MTQTCSKCGRERDVKFMRASEGAWRCINVNKCKRRRYENRRDAQIAARISKRETT